MPALTVDGDFIETEPGFFGPDGIATAFFYYRVCDRASDVFLDAVALGETSRREINRSTYSATCELEVVEPARDGMALSFDIAVLRVGGKSLTYEVVARAAEDGRPLARYETVGVCMDMAGPTPMTIPDEVRTALSLYER
jgi:acyl-CoA thioesterase FadM